MRNKYGWEKNMEQKERVVMRKCWKAEEIEGEKKSRPIGKRGKATEDVDKSNKCDGCDVIGVSNGGRRSAQQAKENADHSTISDTSFLDLFPAARE